MLDITVGYLFKKIYITHRLKQYYIYEFIDYTIGIEFTNNENNDICNIVSGQYAGIYASIINGKDNEGEYAFIIDNINKAIANNGNRVNFRSIREKVISTKSRYYEKNDKNSLTALTDEEILKQLSNKEKKEFDENLFEETTDISTMYNTIKRTIISQDNQIMQILTSLFKNQQVVNSDLDIDLITKLKENILIYGSTGTGKTEILKRISKISKVPIVIEDATSLSETGYQGRKITDMLKDLYFASGKEIEKAEKGILVIDEFDKMAEKNEDGQSHVSRIGVQRSLLKLLDGSIFYFDNDKQFDTSKLTIVVLGAFTDIIKGDDYKNITEEDFIKYGIMRELIGRFSQKIAMNPLLKDDIVKILKNSDFSPLNTYKKLFEMLNVEFKYNDDFIEYIAEIAISKKSGARSLKTVFDDCISSALFRIFAGEYSSIYLIRPSEENHMCYKLT